MHNISNIITEMSQRGCHLAKGSQWQIHTYANTPPTNLRWFKKNLKTSFYDFYSLHCNYYMEKLSTKISILVYLALRISAIVILKAQKKWLIKSDHQKIFPNKTASITIVIASTRCFKWQSYIIPLRWLSP